MKLLSLILAGALMATPAMAQNTSTSSSLSQSGAVINQNSQSIQQAPGVGTAGLVASGGTCLGSSSGGLSGPGFGISFGGTQIDPDCTRRQYAALLAQLGQQQAAIYVTCNNAEVRAALAAAGVACPASGAVRATVASQTVGNMNVRTGPYGPILTIPQAKRYFGVDTIYAVRR